MSTISTALESSAVSEHTAIPVDAQPIRWYMLVAVAVSIALGVGLASLNWNTSVESAKQLNQYNFKENKLEERRVALNKYLIVGYGIFALLGAFAVTQWSSSQVNIFRWWLVFPLLFWLWCGTSILWSVEASTSLRRIGHLYMALAGGFGFAILLRAREAVWALILSMSMILVLGLFAEFSLGTFQPWRSSYRHCGLGHPNETGLFAAMVVIAARVGMIASRKAPIGSRSEWKWFALTVCFGLLIILLTKSRTTLASLVLALLAIELFISTPRRALLLGVSSLSMLASLGMAIALMRTSFFDQLFGVATIGRSSHVASLTGRIPLWEEILKYVDRKPLFGYGYGAYWTTQRVEEFAQIFFWEPPNGHSIYIDCLVEVGGIGLCLMIAMLLIMLGTIAVHYVIRRKPYHLLTVGLLTMAIVHGLTEASFFKGSFGPMIIAFIVFSHARNQSEVARMDVPKPRTVWPRVRRIKATA